MASLKAAGVELAGDRIVPDAAPNAPREDVYRIETYILQFQPDVVVSIGGGSAIDACKAAIALATQGENSPEIEDYFGTGLVTASVDKTGKKMLPHIAVQTSASSGAQLTKYSNVTDPVKGQKKLIVDESVIPTNPVFDYKVTTSMPLSLTIDGALDGIAHCLKSSTVQMKATSASFGHYGNSTETDSGVHSQSHSKPCRRRGPRGDRYGYRPWRLCHYGRRYKRRPPYKFLLVDVTSHGRACGIMNPYYAVSLHLPLKSS